MNAKASKILFYARFVLIILVISFSISELFAISSSDDVNDTNDTQKQNKANPSNVPSHSNQNKNQTEMENPKEIFKEPNANNAPPETPVTQKENLGYFHAINLSGIGNLHITQAEEMDFTVEADKTILPLVMLNVKDQVLNIDLKNASEHETANINYYLKIKNLDEINSYSSSTIFIPNKFETKSLKVSLLSGFGEAKMNLDVTTFVANIIGAGKMEIRGIADEQEITINGVGEYDSTKLKSKAANINMSSSGIAKVNVSETLQVKLTGNGQVRYCGNPNIIKEASNKAIIEPLDPGECK